MIATALRWWTQRWLRGEDLRVGVCLSDDTIVFATRTDRREEDEPCKVLLSSLPKGVVVRGVIREPSILRKMVRDMRAQSFPLSERCALCLPSSLAFVVSCGPLPPGSSYTEGELNKWMSEHIPFALDGIVATCFHPRDPMIDRDGVIIAARASDLREYQDLFKDAGLDVDVMTLPSLVSERERGSEEGVQRTQTVDPICERDLAMIMAGDKPWNVGYIRTEVVCG